MYAEHVSLAQQLQSEFLSDPKRSAKKDPRRRMEGDRRAEARNVKILDKTDAQVIFFATWSTTVAHFLSQQIYILPWAAQSTHILILI